MKCSEQSESSIYIHNHGIDMGFHFVDLCLPDKMGSLTPCETALCEDFSTSQSYNTKHFLSEFIQIKWVEITHGLSLSLLNKYIESLLNA